MNKNYFQKYKSAITELMDSVRVSIDGRPTSTDMGIEELCKIAKWCKKKKHPVYLFGDIDGTDNLIYTVQEELAMLRLMPISFNSRYRSNCNLYELAGGLLIVLSELEQGKEVINITQKCKRHGLYIVSLIGTTKNDKIKEMSDLSFNICYDKKGPIMVMQFLLLQCWIDALAKEI